jgi:SAM-dependent methyltransferase
VVQQIDPERAEDLAGLENCFDTVLCINLLEYLEDPRAVLQGLRASLRPRGVIVVLAPQGRALFGSLDERLGHKRRYGASDLRDLLKAAGFDVEDLRQFNRAGAPPWWVYSKLAGSTRISKLVLKIFDKTVWLWSRVDRLLPWRGLSLIAVARKIGQPQETPGAQAGLDALPQNVSPHAS